MKKKKKNRNPKEIAEMVAINDSMRIAEKTISSLKKLDGINMDSVEEELLKVNIAHDIYKHMYDIAASALEVQDYQSQYVKIMQNYLVDCANDMAIFASVRYEIAKRLREIAKKIDDTRTGYELEEIAQLLLSSHKEGGEDFTSELF